MIDLRAPSVEKAVCSPSFQVVVVASARFNKVAARRRNGEGDKREGCLHIEVQVTVRKRTRGVAGIRVHAPLLECVSAVVGNQPDAPVICGRGSELFATDNNWRVCTASRMRCRGSDSFCVFRVIVIACAAKISHDPPEETKQKTKLGLHSEGGGCRRRGGQSTGATRVLRAAEKLKDGTHTQQRSVGMQGMVETSGRNCRRSSEPSVRSHAY